MTKIFINRKKYYVDISKNLLQTCLNLGIDIPYFCWHPVIGSIGACRQCAVKKYQNKQDKIGFLVMSCMTSIEKNLFITTNDIDSINFRKSIIEFFMINHPHDCPVCEEGGNCHLQDMTVMSKHFKRRFRFKKRTYNNQNLGNFISHEMNRCITCYRCVRYYKDYAGGKDFDVFGANQNIYFGRIKDGNLESEYSGNLVEICPTGVFTDKTSSLNYVRKWDLQYAPSICSHCSVGCNIIVGSRNGFIRKIENRYHEEINHYFLCDLGRFNYDYNNNIKSRLSDCFQLIKNKLHPVKKKKFFKKILKKLRIQKNIIGIGSSRSSIENNFLLLELVGEKNFCTGMTQKEHDCIKLITKILKNNLFNNPSLKEIESHDVILILGEDITQTSSRLALSIRQAMKNNSENNFVKSKMVLKWNSFYLSMLKKNNLSILFNTCIQKTKLDDISELSYYGSIKQQEEFALNIFNCLKNKNFFKINNYSKEYCSNIFKISKFLLAAKKPLIISGSNSFSTSLIKIAFNISLFLKKNNLKPSLKLLTMDVNHLGISLLKGQSLENVFNRAKNLDSYSIIILENDLYRHCLSSDVNVFFKNSEITISLDHQFTKTVKNSNLVLPTCNFFESSGTVINDELRAQKFFQVYKPNFHKPKILRKSSWKWLNKIKIIIDKKYKNFKRTDDVLKECIKKFNIFKHSNLAAPNSNFRRFNQKIPRFPNRFTGRAVSNSKISIHERQQPIDKDTMFSFSSEGSQLYEKNSSCIPFVWYPGWNSNNAWNKFQNEIFGSTYSGNLGFKIFNKPLIKFKNKYFKNIFIKKTLQSNYFVIAPFFNLFLNNEMSKYSKLFCKINKSLELKAFINLKDAKKNNIFKEGLKYNFIYKKNKFNIFIYFSKILPKRQISISVGNIFPKCLIGKKIKIFKINRLSRNAQYLL